MTRARVLILMIIVAALTVSLAACGGGEEDGGAPTTAAGGAPTATTGSGGDAGGDASGGAEAEAGKKIAQAQCLTCHTVDGRTLVGPSWKGLYGSTVELEDGSTVTADDAYIRESIVNPNAKIHKGFPAAMPSFDGVLSDEQVDQLIAYIKTVK